MNPEAPVSLDPKGHLLLEKWFRAQARKAKATITQWYTPRNAMFLVASLLLLALAVFPNREDQIPGYWKKTTPEFGLSIIPSAGALNATELRAFSNTIDNILRFLAPKLAKLEVFIGRENVLQKADAHTITLRDFSFRQFENLTVEEFSESLLMKPNSRYEIVLVSDEQYDDAKSRLKLHQNLLVVSPKQNAKLEEFIHQSINAHEVHVTGVHLRPLSYDSQFNMKEMVMDITVANVDDNELPKGYHLRVTHSNGAVLATKSLTEIPARIYKNVSVSIPIEGERISTIPSSYIVDVVGENLISPKKEFRFDTRALIPLFEGITRSLCKQQLKIPLLGESGSGKTTFIQIHRDAFEEEPRKGSFHDHALLEDRKLSKDSVLNTQYYCPMGFRRNIASDELIEGLIKGTLEPTGYVS